MTASPACSNCGNVKISNECGLCASALCRKCAQFVEPDSFSFRTNLPEPLRHRWYCPPCHDTQVAPALTEYEALVREAEDAFVFFKTQRKAVPLLKRAKEKVCVPQCADRDETILRLAFLAVEQGYNAIVETEIVAEKVRHGSRQHRDYRGTAFPALVDAEKIERHDFGGPAPN